MHIHLCFVSSVCQFFCVHVSWNMYAAEHYKGKTVQKMNCGLRLSLEAILNSLSMLGLQDVLHVKNSFKRHCVFEEVSLLLTFLSDVILFSYQDALK